VKAATQIINNHVRTSAGEEKRVRLAQASTSTSDYDYLVIEP